MLTKRMTNEHALQDLLRITIAFLPCLPFVFFFFYSSSIVTNLHLWLCLQAISIKPVLPLHGKIELALNQHLFEQDIEMKNQANNKNTQCG